MALRHLPRDIGRAMWGLHASVATRCLPVRRGQPHTLPGKLVVSLTSHPARFSTLDITLRCLLNQDMAPDALLLWVAVQDYPRLPPRVTSLQDLGLSILTCDDMRSYNKIVPALLTYPDAYIAICDDDMLYARDWLRCLVQGYSHPDEAVAVYAKRFTLAADEFPLPYSEWPAVKVDERPSRLVQPMGSSGVLYPPGFLPPATTNGEFMRICPEADDLWLYWMFAQAGKTAHRVRAAKVRHCPGTQAVGLKHRNDFAGGNDRQIAALVRAYGLPITDARPESPPMGLDRALRHRTRRDARGGE